jgi:hypothetical protein
MSLQDKVSLEAGAENALGPHWECGEMQNSYETVLEVLLYWGRDGHCVVFQEVLCGTWLC